MIFKYFRKFLTTKRQKIAICLKIIKIILAYLEQALKLLIWGGGGRAKGFLSEASLKCQNAL